ncbi:hypothetical protein ACRZS8_005067, partial [Escherichia coli]
GVNEMVTLPLLQFVRCLHLVRFHVVTLVALSGCVASCFPAAWLAPVMRRIILSISASAIVMASVVMGNNAVIVAAGGGYKSCANFGFVMKKLTTDRCQEHNKI